MDRPLESDGNAPLRSSIPMMRLYIRKFPNAYTVRWVRAPMRQSHQCKSFNGIGRHRLISHVFAHLLALTLATSAFSAESDLDLHSYEPEVQIVRINSDLAPVIDGDLSDPAWQLAAKVDKFYQVDPVEGMTPSEATVVYIAYDEDNLYFGFYCYTETPENIIASIMQRDGDVWKDDHVRIYLDPYNSARDAFIFITNPLGAKQDRLLENNAKFVDEWDTLWEVASKIVDDGWTAEFAIPFRSISFDPSITSWGLDVSRQIRHRNENVRWSQINQSLGVDNVSRIGRMADIQSTSKGLGLDVQGFAALQFDRDRTQSPREDDTEADISGNIYYKFTPALTGTLTFNTDFSDTPLDERQVNTGRFGLFFPETRDFFLQDQSIFEFGGKALTRPGSSGANGLPFFSRQIGIVDGQVVDIVAGAKLSGRLGPANIGALTVRMDSAIGLDSQTLSVARVSLPIFEESKIGAIVTHGDPSGLDDNTVFGIDFQYLDSSFLDYGGRFIADFFYQRSMSEEALAAGQGMNDDSFGFYVGYPNDHTSWSMAMKQIGEFFAPELGFLNRSNIRDYRADYTLRTRPLDSSLLWWEITGRLLAVTDLDDRIEDRNYVVQAKISNQIGDVASLRFRDVRENITNGFDIAGVLPVPIGDYYFNETQLEFESSVSRLISGTLVISCCEIYDGDYFSVSTEVDIRASKYLRLLLQYDMADFKLPSGELTVHVGSIELGINFSPDMQIDTQVQYDNISEQFSLSSRFRWFPRPETEFFLALGHTAHIPDEDFPRNMTSEQTQVVFRVGHIFRF